MFVVVTAAFRLLYVSVILGHARRKILLKPISPCFVHCKPNLLSTMDFGDGVGAGLRNV